MTKHKMTQCATSTMFGHAYLVPSSERTVALLVEWLHEDSWRHSAFYRIFGNHVLAAEVKSCNIKASRDSDVKRKAEGVRSSNTLQMQSKGNARSLSRYVVRHSSQNCCLQPNTHPTTATQPQRCTLSKRFLQKCWKSRTSC